MTPGIVTSALRALGVVYVLVVMAGFFLGMAVTLNAIGYQGVPLFCALSVICSNTAIACNMACATT